jgi:hypothetical protein
MDFEEKYKEETGFSVGKIHDIGTIYYSDDYVDWLVKQLNMHVVSNNEAFIHPDKPIFDKMFDTELNSDFFGRDSEVSVCDEYTCSGCGVPTDALGYCKNGCDD